MRNVIALVLVLATFGIVPALKAQEQSSRFELYAGYDYVRYHASPRITGVPASESFNANSGSSQFVVNPNNWLGLVGEFTAYAVARQGSPPLTKCPTCSDRESL